MSSINLLIHNIGYVFSSFLILCIPAFIYIKDHKPAANRALIFAFVATGVFTVSHLIGVNITDPHLSKLVLMFNTSNLLISCFLAHCVLAFLGKDKEHKSIIATIYAVSVLLLLVYIVFPDTFLHDSVPKMYFPNYYVPGSLHWLMRVLSNILIPAYFLYQMIASYRTADVVMRNRLKYLFFGLFLGYGFGFTAVPLVYDIAIDPVWSIFFVVLFAIPFAYGVFKYDLLDIRIVAKQALKYASLVVLVGIIISFLNVANNFVTEQFPGFPLWALPLFSALMAVTMGFFVWNKIRETDVLKYEFMTVITHKFRTPLTRIKWSAENLAKTALSDESREDVSRISSGADNLVGLTNMLVSLSESENYAYGYTLRPIDIHVTLADLVSEYSGRMKSGRSTFALLPGGEGLLVVADDVRLKAILQILADNAVSYSPQGGAVTFSVVPFDAYVLVKISDQGVGISKEEMPRLFNKFFRGAEAKKIDTEGMGIGLFMARRMTERQGGKLWAESEGQGKGSTFYIKLPAVRAR